MYLLSSSVYCMWLECNKTRIINNLQATQREVLLVGKIKFLTASASCITKSMHLFHMLLLLGESLNYSRITFSRRTKLAVLFGI